MIFLLVRHAATDHIGVVISGWTPGVHLNEPGRKQAQELARRLSPLDLAAIYSSPLERALETAAPLARTKSLEIQQCEALGELRFGEWTGRTLDELEGDELWIRFNKLRSVTRIPGGESMLEVQARAINVLEGLQEQHGERDRVVLVSHGDVIRSVVAFYAGTHLDLFQRIEISPASVSSLELNRDSCRVLCVNCRG